MRYIKENKLTGTQLFIAGSIIGKLVEELKKQDMDTDTEKAINYLMKKFDNIQKEIAEAIFNEIAEGISKIREVIEEN